MVAGKPVLWHSHHLHHLGKVYQTQCSKAKLMSSSTNANFPPVYIRTRIPKEYHRQPIISRLISRYGLTVNIAAALLGSYSRNYGWSDLELLGSSQKVEAGLAYMQALNVEVFQLTLKNLLEARMKKSLQGFPCKIDVPIAQMHTITPLSLSH